MTRPRLLDLFCGAGGCSVGYHRAGFDVTGVDVIDHPDYPYELIVADALEVLADTAFLAAFDVIHASPPCPRYSSITGVTGYRERHPDLIPPVQVALRSWGGVWVIENVPGAPLSGAVVICGPAMGLPNIKRHRLFSSNEFLLSPGCACDGRSPFGIYGDHGDKNPARPHPDGYRRAGKARDVAHAQLIMGIDWMTRWDDLADALPPAYTEYIGAQLLDHVRTAVA